jgi:hypothetical protein
MHLGELAAAKTESNAEPISFDWHGVTIRTRTELPALPLLELAATGESVKGTPAENDLMVVAGAFYRFLESVIDPADWIVFRQVATDNGDGPEQLLPLIEQLGAAISGRPTGRPSGSPAGRSPTTGGSTEHLPSRVSTPAGSAPAG